MSLKIKKILVVVEGEKLEVEVLKKVFELYNINSEKYHIIPYRTNIYDLYIRLKQDEYFDIKNYLISRNESLQLEDVTEVLLFFDLDIHHRDRFDNTVFTKELIIEVLEFFDYEFNNGKLFINYPMMESFKDIESFEIEEYMDKVIDSKNSHGYKELLSRNPTLINSARDLDLTKLILIINANLYKKNKFVNGQFRKPTMDEYIEYNEKTLFAEINKSYLQLNKIPVLNSIILIVLEYMTKEERKSFIEIS